MQDEKDAPPGRGETSRQSPQSPQSPPSQQCDGGSIAPASGGTHYLIVGLTLERRTFRPSDWPERLAGVVALFISERGTQTTQRRRQFASPVVHDGIKSLLIDAALRDACPDAFTFVSSFAAENALPMHDYVQRQSGQ